MKQIETKTCVSMSFLSQFHFRILLCFLNFFEALERIKPRYRFMSAYEQRVPASENQNGFVMDLSIFGGAPENMIEFEVEPPEAHRCEWSRDRITVLNCSSLHRFPSVPVASPNTNICSPPASLMRPLPLRHSCWP